MRGWTQAELAERAGLERTYLTCIEAGPSVILVDRILRLLRRLDVDLIATFPDSPDGAAPDAGNGEGNPEPAIR